MSLTPEDVAGLERAVLAGLRKGWRDDYSAQTVATKVTEELADQLAALLGQHVEAAKREALLEAAGAVMEFEADCPDRGEPETARAVAEHIGRRTAKDMTADEILAPMNRREP